MTPVPQAIRAVAAALILASPAGFTAEDYGPEDAAPWLANALVWDKAPLDVSFLNHTPAGKFGRVIVRGEQLVFEKSGAPARFWSVNLAGQACFGPEDDTAGRAYLATVAQRLAALGFNHVRLHHTDNKPNANSPGGIWTNWSGPSVVDYTARGTLTFNAKALDRLDYLITQLKQRGIYVYVDLFNLREFDEHDGIADLAELRKFSKNKYAFHVDANLQRNMKAFAANLARHRNPHTGATWGDETAICMATLTNENDYTFYTTKQVLDNPTYRAKSLALARQFVAQGKLDLDPEKAVRFLTPEHNRFAALVEETVYTDMIAAARTAGWHALISAGNWSYRGPVSVLGKVRSGDFTDSHAYQSESCFLFDDPATTRTIYTKLAGAHVAGRPFVVSEWQTGRSATKQMHLPHRATSVIAAAAIGAHQGWDGISFFCYAGPWDQAHRVGGGYDSALDPAQMGVMPAAALLYRRDVTESPGNTVVLMSDSDTFGGKLDQWSAGKPTSSNVPVAFLTGFERTKTTLAFERDYQPTPGATVLRGVEQAKNLLGPVTASESDTRQLRRDWQAGWQIIDTPRSQVAQGFYGGSELRTADVTFKPTNKFAVIAVSSLTDEPIAQSPRLFITAMGPSHRVEGRGENYRSQCLSGTVSVRLSPARRLVRLTPIHGDGQLGPPITLKADASGRVTVDLALAQVHWWTIEATSAR